MNVKLPMPLRLAAAICTVGGFVAPSATQSQGAPATSPGLKGVFEPINYLEDISFTDVFFVTPEIGYVGGAAGTILKTTDAGATWTPLLGGDPLSEERAIAQLVFVTPTTGWATQIASQTNLLRTTDGETWELLGTIPEHYDDLAFSSETDGVYIYDRKIFRTQDGGRTWSEVYHCAFRAQIAGLMRQLECSLWKGKVRFATPTVAYALGDAVDADAAVVLKSTDAGASWNVVAVLENQYAIEGGMSFIDENTGYISMKDGTASFRTTDGGLTWTGMPATAIHRRIAFADPEVGWTIRYDKLSYTTDGGRRWASRTLELPAFVNAFSLPRRDIGYLVGDHGMIYRYRTVEASTPLAPNAVAGVAMPPLANDVIEDLGELEVGLESIEATLAKAETPSDPSAPAGTGEPVSQDSGWIEANYAELATFETTIDSVATGLPELGRKHRNLNLLLEGLRLVGDLTGQGGGIKNAFASLRQAKDPASVSTALLELHGQLDAAKASVVSFEDTSAQ